MALIPGHLILVEHDPSGAQLNVGVWGLQSLMLQETGDRRELKIPPILCATIPLPEFCRVHDSCSDFTYQISAHPSPLREDVYTLWVLMNSIPQGNVHQHPNCAVRKFRLLFGKRSLSLIQTQSWEVAARIYLGDTTQISYAGHVGIADLPSMGDPHPATFQILPLDDPTWDPTHHGGQINRLKEKCVQMSAYSGALTYCEADRICITYFD
jgi:hypothetical protein